MTTAYITADPNNILQLNDHIKEILEKRKSLQENLTVAEASFSQAEDKAFKEQGFLGKLFAKKVNRDDLLADLEQARKQVSAIQDELANMAINIDTLYTNVDEDDCNNLISQFATLCKSRKIWNILASNTSNSKTGSLFVDRKEISLAVSDVVFIQSKYKALYFKNLAGSELFVYPGLAVISSADGEISFVPSKELSFIFRPQRFIEQKYDIPADTKTIGASWNKANKDGSPDLRYSDNFQTPVVRYGYLQLLAKNITATYHISNYEATEAFSTSLAKIISQTNVATEDGEDDDKGDNTLSRQYFKLLNDFADELTGIVDTLSSNETIKALVAKSLDGSSFEDFIAYCVLYDLCQVTKMLNDGDFSKNPLATAGLVILSTKILRNSSDLFQGDYNKAQLAYSKGILSKVSATVINFGNSANPFKMNGPANDGSEVLCLTNILKATNDPLFSKYASMVYQCANVIAKADDKITKKEEERLKKIYKITTNPAMGQVATPAAIAATNETIEEIVAELESLVGIQAVKEEIKTLINFVKIQKARQASGLKSSPVSYHMVFTGNPGTGKTTVARIVAKIYKALGILSGGQLVETDRSGLVAEYVGQTAVKVNKTIDAAINGVLFIDEAYSLAGDSENDYGKEAIATLIKRMEDDRDKLVIIMAGYTAEMNAFIEINPGFKSRINRYIEFSDFDADNLLLIFEGECTKMDYILTADAKVKLSSLFTKAYEERNKSFGNGRFVRNTFENALENQANRIASITSLTKEVLTTITADDIQ